LIEALDGIEPKEIIEKPARFTVQDAYSFNNQKVTVGRVESGTLNKGDHLIFQPSGIKGKIENIIVFPDKVDCARTGDSIGIMMGCTVERGNVGGHLQTPPISVDRFLGEVVLLEGILKCGDQFEMKCGTKKIICLVQKIKERISSETGEVIERNPETISENEAATVVFKTKPLVVERFAELPELGRFILVKDGKNIGAGVVLELQV
jgi:elongation factor 1-alpha